MRTPRIFAVLRTETEPETSFLFETWDEYHRATFDPEIETAALHPLAIHGRTYRDRQSSLRELAIDIQRDDQGGLSWGECQALGNFFERNARKLGLLSEFRENAIC